MLFLLILLDIYKYVNSILYLITVQQLLIKSINYKKTKLEFLV